MCNPSCCVRARVRPWAFGFGLHNASPEICVLMSLSFVWKMSGVSEGPVKVERLDDGGPKEKGHFRCTECEWENYSTYRSSATLHVKRTHDRRVCETIRTVPRVQPPRPNLRQDPTAVADRERMRKYRASKKVRTLGAAGRQGSLESGGVLTAAVSRRQEAYDRAERLGTWLT